MRFVIFGAGAVGGVVGARLHRAGYDVSLIARGAHYEALAHDGLTLEQPDASSKLEIPVVDGPERLRWRAGDVVVLATKSQDTAGALAALASAAPLSTPIVCMQNGVENERLALRAFADVYGAVVMAPTAHLEPGVVQAYAAPLTGIVDVGRYPSGVDACCRELAEALASSTFSSRARPEIMRSKYAKLLGNLSNAVEAVCGPEAPVGELVELAREEGRSCLRAAGIEFEVDQDDATQRWYELSAGRIAGRQRGGGSTWQSLARGAAGVETDYLNGEIVLIGRLTAVPTPVNERLCALVHRMSSEGRPPGSFAAREVLDGVAEAEAG